MKITHVLPVSIPKYKIHLFKLSIPKEYYDNVRLKTLDSLKEKIVTSFTFPKGKVIFLSNHISCRLDDYSTATK